MADDLLPPNATPLERAYSGVTKRLTDIPSDVDRAFRPYKTPSDFLPFLSWERSVDLWESWWSDATRRNIIARSYPLHKRKGTAYALREFIRYAGGKVIRIEKPPGTIFSGPSLTRAERERWLASLPQIRTWRVREKWNAPRWKSFYGSKIIYNAYWQGPNGKPYTFAIPSTALERSVRRARWVVKGVETDSRVTTFNSYYRVHVKGNGRWSVFNDTPAAPKKFYAPSTARRRLFTVSPKAASSWRFALGPSVQAVTAEPERVKVRGTRGKRVFADVPCRMGCYAPSTAYLRIYHRWSVNDGSRQKSRGPITFMGRGRYGLPPHTALVTVQINGKKSPFSAGIGIVVPKSRFWMPHVSKLGPVLRASRAAKRLTDRILLLTGPDKKFIAGRKFLAGEQSYIVGRPN
jgi:phage tail P2-like protein